VLDGLLSVTRQGDKLLFLALHSHVQRITHEDPGPAESGLDGDASHLEAELLNAIWRHPSVQNCSHLRYFRRGRPMPSLALAMAGLVLIRPKLAKMEACLAEAASWPQKSILRTCSYGCFERTANDARRHRFFNTRYVRMASRNVSSTISGQEHEWDMADGQNIGDPESHFARKLKVKRHAV
jgi:hypothetical protein